MMTLIILVILMRKGFIVRDRSLSSLPSKQLSINEFMTQKSIALQTYRSKAYEQSKILSEKEEDIVKLKTNLDHALKLAVSEAIQSSKAKEQTMRSTQTKIHIEKKYLEVADQLSEEKMQRMKLEGSIAGLEYQLNKEQEEKRKIKQKQQQTAKQFDNIKKQLTKIPDLQERVAEIDPLKSRIKVLETNIRQQKNRSEDMKKQNKQLEKHIEELNQKIKSTKPYQEQLLQRIAFLERVNLELERKMEDFNRREHDYKKQVLHYKTALAKMTTDRNKFKSDYESTYASLQQKIEFIVQLEIVIVVKTQQIEKLTKALEQKTQESAMFSQKLQETIDYYKTVADQNAVMKKRLAALQQNEEEMRRTLAAHIKVSEQINLYIVNRNAEIMKLEDQKKMLIQNLDVIEKKYSKLDRLFDEESARGATEIKQSYYALIKERNKFALQTKQAKEQLGSKILQFGQERDVFQRKIATLQPPSPSQENLYESIISDKIEQIIMLESSNDQLIKVKKQQEERIRQCEAEIQAGKKEIYNLRLKAAELFKYKKDLEQAKNKCERYQDMIEEQKNQIADYHSQLDILRLKNSQFSEKGYALTMENKNLTFKITELENVMKELDIEYLNGKKIQNEKNAHILTDSIEKLQNGINSLAYYFSCCFCTELLTNPVTLAVCGHNYCTKCKDAYSEYCYECDTGQEIERIYSSKYLKQTAGKYRFLVMVMKEAQANMIKIIF